MVTLGDDARSGAAPRPTRWLLLLVAAGVLAMHGLTGGAHMTMPSGSAGHSSAMAAAVEQTLLAPAPTQSGHSATDICLAVLSALLLLLVAVETYRRRVQDPLLARVRPERARTGRGPPRRRLLELCISRT